MLRTLAALACTLGMAAHAEAQSQPGTYQPNPYQPQTAMSALGHAGPVRGPNTTKYRTAAKYGGEASAQRPVAGVKPFSGRASEPTISPYLNLFRDESQNAAPNYYTFVRPMQEQFEANRRQQTQLQTLQSQVQNQVRQASHTSPAAGVAGGARFGDTGRYYGGWRR